MENQTPIHNFLGGTANETISAVMSQDMNFYRAMLAQSAVMRQ